MASKTPDFGFNYFGPGVPGAITDDGGKFTLGDRLQLSRILKAFEQHDHSGGTRLADPTGTPAVSLDPLGGQLPGGLNVYYRVAYIDQYGLETAGSAEAVVSTPTPLSSPSFPILTATAVDPTSPGSGLGVGTFTYALTAVSGTGETPLGFTANITLDGTLPSVTVTFPATQDAQDHWSVWRKGPNETYFTRLATVLSTDAAFIDDGEVAGDAQAGDPSKQPPSTNLTSATNAITVRVPDPSVVAADPSSVKSWRLYRSFTSGSYASSSLVAEVVTTANEDGTGGLVIDYVDDGGGTLLPGQPLDVSQAIEPSLPIDAGGSTSIDQIDTVSELPFAYYEDFGRIPTGDQSNPQNYIGWSAGVTTSNMPDATHTFDIITDGLPAGYTRAIRPALNQHAGLDTSVQMTFDTQYVKALSPEQIPANLTLTMLVRLTGGLSNTSLLRVRDSLSNAHEYNIELPQFTSISIPLGNTAGRVTWGIELIHASEDVDVNIDILEMSVITTGQTAAPKDGDLKVVMQPTPQLLTFSRARNQGWEVISPGVVNSDNQLNYYVDEGDSDWVLPVLTSGADIPLDPPADSDHLYTKAGFDVFFVGRGFWGIGLVGAGDYQMTAEAHVENLTPGDVIEIEWQGDYNGDWYPKTQFVCPPGKTDVRCRFDVVIQNSQTYAGPDGVSFNNGFVARVYFSDAAGTRQITQYGFTARKITGPPAVDDHLTLPAPNVTAITAAGGGAINFAWSEPDHLLDRTYMAYGIATDGSTWVKNEANGVSDFDVTGFTVGQTYRCGVLTRDQFGHYSPSSAQTLVTVT